MRYVPATISLCLSLCLSLLFSACDGGAARSGCKTNADCLQADCYSCPVYACVAGECIASAVRRTFGGATGAGGNLGATGGVGTGGDESSGIIGVIGRDAGKSVEKDSGATPDTGASP